MDDIRQLQSHATQAEADLVNTTIKMVHELQGNNEYKQHIIQTLTMLKDANRTMRSFLTEMSLRIEQQDHES